MTHEFIDLLELARNGIVAVTGIMILTWAFAVYAQYRIIKTLSNDEGSKPE